MSFVFQVLHGYKLLFRVFIVTLLGTLVLFPLVTNAGITSAISLKDSSIIEGNTITLGDVFDGLSENQDKVLGAAPRPGHDMVLNARTLMRIAIAMDLPWRPSSTADYVVLSRAASMVDRDMIEAALTEAIKEDGLTGKFSLVIPDQFSEIVLPLAEDPQVEVRSLRLKKDRGWFEATLVAPSKENPIKTMKLTGTIKKMVDVPVLKEPLKNGTIIGQHDIEMIEVPESSLKHDTIVNVDELLGMTPRRIITSGAVLTANDVEAAKIVERGDIVVMVFNAGPLALTARGKALEHGTKGDTIRVTNTSSNRTVEAIVTASKEVTVKTF